MKKTKLLQIRVDEQEDQFIGLKMAEHGYKNKSEYIRNSIISPIRHDKKRQLQMLYEINKIGVNLNQAMRKMHASGYIDTEVKATIENTFASLNSVLNKFGEL